MNPDRDSSSCADVQEGATAGSDKATPKACSTGRGAPGPGLGGTPTSVWEYPKRIFSYIARLRYRNVPITYDCWVLTSFLTITQI